MRIGGWLLFSIAPALALPHAAAQSAPAATLLTSQLTGVDAGEGAAFDRTLRARVDALHVVHTEGAVALDLEQIQLALGCMGETAECLAAVADETQTQLVVVPSLARAGDTVVATVLVFDRRDQSMRRGTREVSATDTAALLGSVDGLLREVFGLPAAEVAAHEDPPPPSPTPSPALSPLPIVITAVGGLALVAGAIVGGLSLADASTYQSMSLDSSTQVDAALDVLARQRTEAIAADALLIGGGIVALGGLVWLLAAGHEDGSSPLAISPVVSGTEVGLALRGSFGGAL